MEGTRVSDDSDREIGNRGGIAEAPPLGDERTTLMGFLQRQRDLIAWKVRDATDDVLRRPSTASGLTLHGIVRHLENVERSWFREIYAGEQDLSYDWSDEDRDGEFRVPPAIPMVDVLAAYAAEAARCDAVIRAAPSLDAVAAGERVSLRWILIHLIEETARHLGHADILRETADGAVGEDPA
jgi:uncharacterized damage-inducible protein DinB